MQCNWFVLQRFFLHSGAYVHVQEDLGTARREYISTVDTNNKIRNVTIEAIEAAREANKKGSAVHRLAEKNKDSLNAWNSMFNVSVYRSLELN